MALATRWLVLAWRLPTGPSAPRVSIWRSLKRLGAATLTPGAALLPFREELVEQIGWLAQEIEEEMGGDAWVLPVTELTEAEEASVRNQISSEREAEYRELQVEASELKRRETKPSARELQALQDRLSRIRARDYFGARGGRAAQVAVERCSQSAVRPSAPVVAK